MFFVLNISLELFAFILHWFSCSYFWTVIAGQLSWKNRVFFNLPSLRRHCRYSDLIALKFPSLLGHADRKLILSDIYKLTNGKCIMFPNFIQFAAFPNTQVWLYFRTEERNSRLHETTRKPQVLRNIISLFRPR